MGSKLPYIPYMDPMGYWRSISPMAKWIWKMRLEANGRNEVPIGTLSWDKPTLIMNGPSTGYLLLEYYCKHFLVVFEPHLNMLVDWAPYNAHERSLRSGDMWLKNVKNRVSFGIIQIHRWIIIFSISSQTPHDPRVGYLHFWTTARRPATPMESIPRSGRRRARVSCLADCNRHSQEFPLDNGVWGMGWGVKLKKKSQINRKGDVNFQLSR